LTEVTDGDWRFTAVELVHGAAESLGSEWQEGLKVFRRTEGVIDTRLGTSLRYGRKPGMSLRYSRRFMKVAEGLWKWPKSRGLREGAPAAAILSYLHG
jgi:hypothetical protein